ncbi:MAG: phosphoribosylamine--glycine ligase [Bacteroidia bacterium]|nr:MAG: phosphoribosylamine--glycine ligase [Bacteroidia bacterium]
MLIGSGGREHAMAYALSKSKYCHRLWVAPGNPGTAFCAQNVALNITRPDEILLFCIENAVDIVVVGPEAPLMEGLADVLHQNQIAVIGPQKAGALLEGSKAYAKAFMKKYDIPTANYQKFDKSQRNEAKEYLKTVKFPIVLKASGLAAGKGVVSCDNLHFATDILEQMLNGSLLGDAGETVVIEEFLNGWEISMFILTDGKNYILLPEAKDYKRIGEGNSGPNTGGMGSVSPVHLLTSELKNTIIQKVIEPTLEGIKKENIDYQGFIFFGLMIVQNEPYLLEYNVRMGDPETQSVFSRITSDVGEMFILATQKKLNEYSLRISSSTAVTVVSVSEGYPGSYEKEKAIYLPKSFAHDIFLYHAGTKIMDNQLVTNGGRVLNVTALGNNLAEAIQKAYKANEQIAFSNKYFRKDIGQDLLVLENL